MDLLDVVESLGCGHRAKRRETARELQHRRVAVLPIASHAAVDDGCQRGRDVRATVFERDGIALKHIDVGGGLGIRYQDETPPAIEDYARALLEPLGARAHTLFLEPGRALTGNAGLLLTRVEYLKAGEERNFVVVDAAMNDLLRPALYDAWHDVLPVHQADTGAHTYDVVGPVCESGDFLALDRELAVHEGDLLAIMSAGAYGMSMSSNYNTRPRAAEVMTDGAAFHLIRRRERIADLMAGEFVLP